MHRLARPHHSARTPLFVLALVIALGAAMCVRVHRAVAHPAAARPAGAAGPAGPAGVATAPPRGGRG